MKDTEILSHIEELVNEEHTLWEQAEHGGLDEEQRARLKAVQVHLDQCWDLLRQRRGKRDAGENPDDAKARSESIVEHYQQ
jgi:Protein of unknown function (DUF2630)